MSQCITRTRHGLTLLSMLPALAMSGGCLGWDLLFGSAEPNSVVEDEPAQPSAYFYDLETGELFVDASSRYAPIDAPSGAGNGARTHVFACSEADVDDLTGLTAEDLEDSPAFIGYLERYPEDAKRTLEQGEAGELADDSGMAMLEAMQEAQIRAVDGEEWFPAGSQEGAQLLRRVYDHDCPPGQHPVPLRPEG